MRRVIAVLAAVAVLAVAATGGLLWWLTREPAPSHPEISAYARGTTVRVGPYRYCDVFAITRCDQPRTVGELTVSATGPVQLSVPPAIARAPWILRIAYEDGDAIEAFRPHSKLAVTIPTVDPRRGKLTGVVVQLPTLVRDEAGDTFPWAHAEWSVATHWN